MKRQTLIDTISLLLAFLFVYAAVSKLLDIEKFTVQIGQSPLLTHMAGFVSWCIPTLEIILSVFLILPRFRMAGMIGSFGLMVLFTGYIVSILRFSENIPCACGGVIQRLGWSGHLIFNIGFAILAAVGVMLLSRSEVNTTR